MHFILKKWRNLPILKILYNQHLYFDTHFHWSWRVLEYMSEVRLLGNKSRKYENDARPWNFQGNLQNRLTVVTEHDNRRARRAGYFWNVHVKIPPDNAKNVVPWDVYFENSKGGVRTSPPTPSRSAPALALILLTYLVYILVTFGFFFYQTRTRLKGSYSPSLVSPYTLPFRLSFFYRILVDSSTLPKKIRTILFK